MRTSIFPAAAAALALLSGAALAGTEYRITVTGTVDFNGINSGPLAPVQSGESATVSFTVDEDVFLDSEAFPTRGYAIDQASYQLAFDSATVGLQSPLVGPAPLFVLRDNDPAVDGFFVSTNVNFPVGVPLDTTGIFGQFLNNFSVTYGGSLLSSLDIAGAVGTYDFTGLSVFNWTIDDGGFNAMGLSFAQMTVEVLVPGSATIYGCGVNPAGSMTVIESDPRIGGKVTVGVDNPLGTQAVGSLPILILGFAPAPGFPCGIPLPGFGMAGPGATGELLLAPVGPSVLLFGNPWAGPGMPEEFPIFLPNDATLVGKTIYLQGLLFDFLTTGGVTNGLTDATQVTIGN